MTKEEILAMKAGRELDVLVARELFGVEVEWDYSLGDINHVLPKLPFCKGEPRTVLGPMAHAVSNIIRHYSTDISSAWLVVDRMREEGYVPTLTWLTDKCSCTFRKSPAAWEGIMCSTAPEAICKAALIAKYSTKKESDVLRR